MRGETGTPHSEPFDELSARIFVRSDPRTGDTPRNPDVGGERLNRIPLINVRFRHFLM